MNKVLVVAEAGVNHNGDLSLARQLIDVAAEAGADLIKFQTFVTERNISLDANKAEYQIRNARNIEETQYEMVKKLELSREMHENLIEHCHAQNIGFFSTGFDFESVDLLVDLGQSCFKIPSGEITNLPYLRYIGHLNKTVILSTGMSTLGDIEAAIDILEQAGTPRTDLTILHCTSEYPTPMSEVNLRAMHSIQNALGVAVGDSDHTLGIEVAIAAVAMGATVIEKHFTLDRNLPGPDHQASLEPAELRAMVKAIRNIEVAMGDGIKRLTPSEVRNKPVIRKSLVANKMIKCGEIFTVENLATKRPGVGISPMYFNEVIGKKAPRDFDKDELIEL